MRKLTFSWIVLQGKNPPLKLAHEDNSFVLIVYHFPFRAILAMVDVTQMQTLTAKGFNKLGQFRDGSCSTDMQLLLGWDASVTG